MKNLLVLFLLLLTCVVKSQNLVPNGNFEQYIQCPSFLQQLERATYWINPADSFGTPDYFNTCATTFSPGVPNNYNGYQQPHSGNAYSGIVLYQDTLQGAEYREYLEIQLSSLLVSNTTYHFEMYVNLSNTSNFSTDDIGVYFSDTLISGIHNYYPLGVTPQISNSTGVFTDTTNWTLVSGNYMAAGGEQYLIIGNYKNDASTNMVFLGNNNPFESHAFVYIDDVSLTITTGIEANTNSNHITVSPNPVQDELRVEVKNNFPSEIFIFDIALRKLLQQNFTNVATLNMQQLKKGTYIYEIRSRSAIIKSGTVVKD